MWRLQKWGIKDFFCFVARKCDFFLALGGSPMLITSEYVSKGVRRTGEGLLGNFLTLLGKNLWVAKDLFVILQQKQEIHSNMYSVSI